MPASGWISHGHGPVIWHLTRVARTGATAGLGDPLRTGRGPVQPQRRGHRLEVKAKLVHRGDQRPHRPARAAAFRRQAHGRHHLRGRKQPRPHALPAQLRPRRDPHGRHRCTRSHGSVKRSAGGHLAAMPVKPVRQVRGGPRRHEGPSPPLETPMDTWQDVPSPGPRASRAVATRFPVYLTKLMVP
jgi:hypothetical protein